MMSVSLGWVRLGWVGCNDTFLFQSSVTFFVRSHAHLSVISPPSNDEHKKEMETKKQIEKFFFAYFTRPILEGSKYVLYKKEREVSIYLTCVSRDCIKYFLLCRFIICVCDRERERETRHYFNYGLCQISNNKMSKRQTNAKTLEFSVSPPHHPSKQK